MRAPLRFAPLIVAALLSCAAPAAETSDPAMAAAAPSVTADLLADIGQVESKIVGLARAIPANRYNWKPSPEVRTVAQVFKHIAADNYMMPAALGYAPDPSTGIKGDDYATTQAFEAVDMTPEQIIGELERSFAFVKTSLQNANSAALGDKVTMFGMEFTAQQVWIMTATHVHEHLGQMIAYARSIGIAPPWSN
ncbi:MAG TPA: DinB family protein [Gemmatimonadaceae bacterium]